MGLSPLAVGGIEKVLTPSPVGGPAAGEKFPPTEGGDTEFPPSVGGQIGVPPSVGGTIPPTVRGDRYVRKLPPTVGGDSLTLSPPTVRGEFSVPPL